LDHLGGCAAYAEIVSVTLQAGKEDGQLVISVTDTDKGIPAEELPTIRDSTLLFPPLRAPRMKIVLNGPCSVEKA
jgi:hypothetical protein